MALETQPWIVLTADDLDTYMVAEKAAAMRQEARRLGQPDTFDEVTRNVIRRIRAAVATCERNIVSIQPLAIPPDLKEHALALVVDGISARLGQALTEDERRRVKSAEDTLLRVAKCELLVAPPIDPAEIGTPPLPDSDYGSEKAFSV